jgi:hypothetical protein
MMPVAGVKWTSSGIRNFSQVLLYSDAQEPTPRYDESELNLHAACGFLPLAGFVVLTAISSLAVKELCEVIFTIPEQTIWSDAKSYKSPLDKGKWRDCVFDLQVVFGRATLEFHVFYHSNRVGTTEVRYLDV